MDRTAGVLRLPQQTPLGLRRLAPVRPAIPLDSRGALPLGAHPPRHTERRRCRLAARLGPTTRGPTRRRPEVWLRGCPARSNRARLTGWTVYVPPYPLCYENGKMA